MNSKIKPTLAREYALKFLFHIQLQQFAHFRKDLEEGMHDKDRTSQALKEFHESYREEDFDNPDNLLDNETIQWAKVCIDHVLNNYKTLINTVSSLINHWKINNLDKIDLTILLMAIAEIRYIHTPGKIVVNEAINMAKKYGKSESYSFVNGVLDNFLKKER